MTYAEYLSTSYWLLFAREARARAGYHCQLCDRDDLPLEVHHRRYDRLGDERPDDVIVLCEDCHRRHHGTLRRTRRHAEQSGWLPFDAMLPTGDELN